MIHQKFISVNKFDSKIKNEHLTILTNVLKTLWFRRSLETSFFFDYKLMILSKHHCFIRDCFTKFETQKVYDDFIVKIHIEMKKTLAIKKQKWINNDRINESSKMTTNMWMKMNRTLKILNIFSTLAFNSKTKDLQWTKEELIVQKWAKRIKNDLNNLAKMNSLYERQIEALIDSRYTSKIAKIKRIIDLRPSKKIVFIIMNSINVMILYWVH